MATKLFTKFQLKMPVTCELCTSVSDENLGVNVSSDTTIKHIQTVFTSKTCHFLLLLDNHRTAALL